MGRDNVHRAQRLVAVGALMGALSAGWGHAAPPDEPKGASSATSQIDVPPAARPARSDENSVRGLILQPTPITYGDGTLRLRLVTFDPRSQVRIYIDLPKRMLREVHADAHGRVELNLPLPAASPGVHEISFDGCGEGGGPCGWTVYVDYPGRPANGDDYTTYVCCFEIPPDPDQPITIAPLEPAPANTRDPSILIGPDGEVIPTGHANDGPKPSGDAEPKPGPPDPKDECGYDLECIEITVQYGTHASAAVIYTDTPDENGGLLVFLPFGVIYPPGSTRGITITLRSRTTGKTKTVLLDPIARVDPNPND